MRDGVSWLISFAACSSASYCNWGQARAISAELDYQW